MLRRTPLPRPSVSPLPAMCTVPARSPPLSEALSNLWRWLRRTPSTVAQRRHDDFEVDRLARQMVEDEGDEEPGR